MIKVSKVYNTKPLNFKSELQEIVYNTLEDLSIPFERVDTDEAITMEDCIEIDKRLNVKTVKTLFLCNRQKTNFYLYITLANKAFNTKNFSSALNISRLSFAPEDLMKKLLGTKIGSSTVFSTLIDHELNVQVVFDKEVLADEYYGCSDGTTTCYMKLRTSDLLNNILPYSKHNVIVIEI